MHFQTRLSHTADEPLWAVGRISAVQTMILPDAGPSVTARSAGADTQDPENPAAPEGHDSVFIVFQNQLQLFELLPSYIV